MGSSAALCALSAYVFKVCKVHPSAAVPREAALEIDVRDIDGLRRDGVLAAVKGEAAAIATRRKVGVWLEAGDGTAIDAGRTRACKCMLMDH